jgi:RNA polymerase sigma-70 factor (ECF subfamily)
MDKDCVLELIEEMSNQLQRYAKALTRDNEKAERLLKKTIQAALKESISIPENNPQRWIYTIMRDLFVEDYKKEIRANIMRDRVQETQIELMIKLWHKQSPTA